MAIKFSKTQLKQFEKFKAELTKNCSELHDAIEAYNDIVAEHTTALTEAQTEFNATISELRDFVSEITNNWQEQLEHKKAAWHETDAGADAVALLQEWQGLELEEIEFEIPDEIEVDVPEVDDIFDGLSFTGEGE